MPILFWAIPAGLTALGFAGWGLSVFMDSLSSVLGLALILAALFFGSKDMGLF